MQHFLNRALRLSALIGALSVFAFSGQAQAQVPVHPASTVMFFDGVGPRGGLVSDGAALYGATGGGLYAAGGLLYRLALDTASFGAINSIYQFGRLDIWNGAFPGSGVLLGSDGELYGTTIATSYDSLRFSYNPPGTIYRVSRTGLNYVRLFTFDPVVSDSRTYAVNATGAMQLPDPNGFRLQGPLIEGQESGIRYLYGGAFTGGPDGTGTIFKVRADGTGFQVLAPFGAAYLKPGATNPLDFDFNANLRLKNLNGLNPTDRLLLGGDGYVYGVTRDGGTNGTGVIFRVPLAGGSIEILNEFDAIVPGVVTTDPTTGAVTSITRDTNAEGGYPVGGMVLSGGMLYGTTSGLGPNGYGTVFRIARDGSGYTVLRAFNFTDGGTPTGDLIVTSDGMLAGTTREGGTLPTDQSTGQPVAGTAKGTVYKLSFDGVTYSEQCVFNSADEALVGSVPNNGVVQIADGSFYGTTETALYGAGLVYKCGDLHSGPVLGIRPFVDQGGGSIPMWLLALLTAVLGLRVIRDSSAKREARISYR